MTPARTRRDLELRHLRCFLAIAEERNITRAAARLGLTQPAASRTLATLETALGVRLVDRSTHHLTLTPEGETFRVRAAAAVTAFGDALDVGRAEARPLRLGHSWSAAGRFTTPLLRRWRRAHPDVPLELLRHDDRTAGLASGSTDAALLRGPVDSPGLVAVTLFTEHRVAAVPSDSPLAERPELALADLAPHPVALNPVSGTTTLALWPAATRPTRALTVANTDDWLAVIAADRAVGVTSAATPGMHPHPGVTFVPLTDAPPLPVSLAWPDRTTHPALPALVRLAQEITAGA